MPDNKKTAKLSETLKGLLGLLLLLVLLFLFFPCNGCSPEEHIDVAPGEFFELESSCEGWVQHEALSPYFQPPFTFHTTKVDFRDGLWHVYGSVRSPGRGGALGYHCTADCFRIETDDTICLVKSVTFPAHE